MAMAEKYVQKQPKRTSHACLPSSGRSFGLGSANGEGEVVGESCGGMISFSMVVDVDKLAVRFRIC